VLVWVHGGAWVGGDKANPESIDRARYAASLGYALVSTNYRLANKFGRGTWPDYPNDVADAIAHVVSNASSLRLDAEHISLLGHSAGGHTVAIVSADPSYLASRDLAPDTIDCVVANDTEGYRLEDRDTAYPEAIENAFGTDPSVLADASPSVGIERHGAPSTRYLVVTRGSARRQEVASEFVELIKEAGGDARLLIAGDYSHSEVNLALGEPGETIVTPPVSEFLTDCRSPGAR
jgi:acetyl esterase/lipase